MKSIVKKTSNKYSNSKIVWFPEKLLSMQQKVVTTPLYVRVKPINTCCHDCYFCVYNSKNSAMHDNMKLVDKLSKEKLFEILNDFKDMGVRALTYSGGGEPLMHPDIVEVMEKTKEFNIDLSIITNGQLLSGERAKTLRKAKWIRISMDYCDEEGFIESRMRDGKQYTKLLENIKNFAEIKDFNCDLSINYIITNKNYTKIYQAAKLLKDLKVDNVRFSPVWMLDFLKYHEPIKDLVKEQLLLARNELQTEEYTIYDSYNIIPDVTQRKYTKCYVLQYNPVIGADGKVYNCHNKSYTDDGCIGSITNQSFKQMWFSEQTRKYFEEFNPQIHCQCQCANDKKNLFMHELIDCYGDNFI